MMLKSTDHTLFKPQVLESQSISRNRNFRMWKVILCPVTPVDTLAYDSTACIEVKTSLLKTS